MPKISIILPVYNTEKYLEKCLTSIKNQSNQDYELIAVNDGSTDHSLDILEKYQTLFKEKMILIDQKNKGVVKSRKVALDQSTAPYLAFIDSDDYISPRYLESLETALEEQNTNLAIARFAIHFNYPGLRKIGFKDQKRTKESLTLSKSKESLPTINVVTTAKLIKRKYLELPKEKWQANEDLSINYLNFARADKIRYAPNATYHYQPNHEGLVATKLTGYSYENIKNTCLPLDELKRNFEQAHLAEFYSQELECIYIKNILQRINTLFSSDETEEEKTVLANCMLHYLEKTYPTWEENPYYRNHFTTMEVPDTLSCLKAQQKIKKLKRTTTAANKEEILTTYQKIWNERRK